MFAKQSLLKASVSAAALTGLLALPGLASAEIRITEWMYDGTGGEFVELTNVGSTAVDFTGWSFDDDSRNPNVLAGAFSLTGFGIVNPGESVVFSEATAAAFRSAWGLSNSVDVLGGYTNNLGRADEINIYDSTGTLVDRLTFGDQAFPGSPRTTGKSGNPNSFAVLGTNDPLNWVLSANGDTFGSYTSTNNTIGNPGTYSAVPLPAALPLLGSALLGFFGIGRRRRAGAL